MCFHIYQSTNRSQKYKINLADQSVSKQNLEGNPSPFFFSPNASAQAVQVFLSIRQPLRLLCSSSIGDDVSTIGDVGCIINDAVFIIDVADYRKVPYATLFIY